jgi:hypothetical protein
MRTILMIAITSFISFGAMAQAPKKGSEKKDTEKYCVEMKNNHKEIQYKGKAITSEVQFKNGSKIKADGTFLKTDGSTITLKVGECVNKDGVMSLLRQREEVAENK